MEQKPCPVDRKRLLVGLSTCSNAATILDTCPGCPYKNKARTCIVHVTNDALEYICYLEEQLNAKAVRSD